MDWLTNTSSHKKRGFFIAYKEIEQILCGSLYNAMIKILFIVSIRLNAIYNRIILIYVGVIYCKYYSILDFM